MQTFVKNLTGNIFLIACFISASAQNKSAYEMTVNGVKVIVQPSGNEIVQVLTLFKGGVQNYPADRAGIEDLAITALTECGTKKDSKNAFKDKLDKATSRFHSTSEQAATLAKLSNVKKLIIGHFSSTYETLDEFLNEAKEVFPNTQLALEGQTYIVP